MRNKEKIDLDLYVRLGEELKEARVKKHMSQREVGRLIGKSDVAIMRYETAQSRIDMETLDRLCRVLGITKLKCVDEGKEDLKEALYQGYIRSSDDVRKAVRVLLGIEE